MQEYPPKSIGGIFKVLAATDFQVQKVRIFRSEIWAFRVILDEHFLYVEKVLPSFQLHFDAFILGICLTGSEFWTIFNFYEGSIFWKPEVENFSSNVIKIVCITITTASDIRNVPTHHIKKSKNCM